MTILLYLFAAYYSKSPYEPQTGRGESAAPCCMRRHPSRHTTTIQPSAPAFFATSCGNILYTQPYTLRSELVESALPDSLHGILRYDLVTCDYSHIFRLRLCDDKTVKRVAMN